jgi:hypothetical protein
MTRDKWDVMADVAGAVTAREHVAYTMPTYRRLLAFHRRDQVTQPSQAWLAEATGLSVRTVRRHIAILRQLKLIDVHGHPAKHDPATGQWRRRTNRYCLRWPPKKPRPLQPGQMSASPRGHGWPQYRISSMINGGRPPAAPPTGPPTSTAVPITPTRSATTVSVADMVECFDCHAKACAPGKWRCPTCQARVDMRRATATLAGQPAPSKWRRKMSPIDTADVAPDDQVMAGWLPYRDD